MSEKEWLSKGLDKAVIPLVAFFNKNGLSTVMSCQGHNKNQSVNVLDTIRQVRI